MGSTNTIVAATIGTIVRHKNSSHRCQAVVTERLVSTVLGPPSWVLGPPSGDGGYETGASARRLIPNTTKGTNITAEPYGG